MPAKHEAWPLGDRIGVTVAFGTVALLAVYGGAYVLDDFARLSYFAIESRIPDFSNEEVLYLAWAGSFAALLLAIGLCTPINRPSTAEAS